MNLELIQSVSSVTPTKGTNAGKPMFVINGKHWSKVEPSTADTHICLEEVTIADKKYMNVIGFSQDRRMPIAEKIAMLTQHDAGYSLAIATLLK